MTKRGLASALLGWPLLIIAFLLMTLILGSCRTIVESVLSIVGLD